MTNREIIQDARVRLKQIAGRMLARKEAAEASLEQAQKSRAEAEQERALVASSGRADLAAQYASVIAELDARIETLRGEAALADQNLKETLAEMKNLEGTERDLERAAVHTATAAAAARSGDPFSLRAEDVALRNVREHLEHLEARLALDRELARPEQETKELDQATRELRAKEELAALKARRKTGGADEEPGGDVSPSGDKPSGDKPGGRTL
ncbi:MAG: hypothetical protein IT384_16565 [Deltaproteobacteria bacterium]|nr:hypothetical protein [Deltaproteobacteria bacterium]